MLVKCPECHKELNVPESAQGKKVRCPGCKNVVAVPAPPAAAAPAPLNEAKRAEAKKPRAAGKDVEAGPPASPMRCAACKAAAVEALPANLFSRQPGYVCRECGALMRPPGSFGINVAIIALGVFILLLFGVMVVAVLSQEEGLVFRMSGVVFVAALGLAAIIWGAMQLRKPIPLDVPRRPIRWGFWILALVVLPLVLLLLIGGGVFFMLYYIHEMM